MKIKLKKFSQRARTPKQRTSGSSGFDLDSTKQRVVSPCSSVPIPTDIGKIPRGYLGTIHLVRAGLLNLLVVVEGSLILTTKAMLL